MWGADLSADPFYGCLNVSLEPNPNGAVPLCRTSDDKVSK